MGDGSNSSANIPNATLIGGQGALLGHRGTLLLLILALALLLAPGCGWLSADEARPPIVYVGWEETGAAQLYRLESNGEIVPLTPGFADMFDPAVSPDGRRVAFVAVDDDGESSLWLVDAAGGSLQELLACGRETCSRPVWDPHGNRLLYERRELNAQGDAGSPRLWWLDPQTRRTVLLLEDENAFSVAASFSPDGRWLSYFAPEAEGIRMVALQDGVDYFLTTEVGAPAAWSPDGSRLVVPGLDLVVLHGEEGEDHESHTHDFQSATSLALFDVRTGEQEPLSGDALVEDGAPAWSPDGEWIAFGRKPPRTSSGRQIWLMRADGSAALPLTADPAVHYGPPAWSPDGRYLLLQRFSPQESSTMPTVWILDVETGAQTLLAEAGMQPAWLAPLPGA